MRTAAAAAPEYGPPPAASRAQAATTSPTSANRAAWDGWAAPGGWAGGAGWGGWAGGAGPGEDGSERVGQHLGRRGRLQLGRQRGEPADPQGPQESGRVGRGAQA